MARDAREKARAEVRRAQSKFEQTNSAREKASAARRESFDRAQAAGLSLRDIAAETGLHFSRVAEILRGN